MGDGDGDQVDAKAVASSTAMRGAGGGRSRGVGRPRCDRATFAALLSMEVANANGRVIPFTLEATRQRITGRNAKPEFCDFTVYDRADQAPIGWSSLFHIDHRNGSAQFGIDLGERRGQGLGTEATRLTLDWGFSVLGLHNIMLAVAAWNERATRVSTKVGFREMGRRRGAGLTMGHRDDGVFMDLLASEFLHAGGSVLAGRAPHGLRPASR